MNPLCSKLIEDLPKDAQPNIRSLTVDSSLRVKVRPAKMPRRHLSLRLRRRAGLGWHHFRAG